jgi:hypothetical protein
MAHIPLIARFQILPAEQRFYDWFEKGAANAVAAGHSLVQAIAVVDRGGDPTDVVRRLTEIEHRSDCIVH